jgi:D-tyrosyl-tRNA(Tyr) deacylase
MRSIVQRVKYAKVTVDNKVVGEIKEGIMALVGFGPKDDRKTMEYIADKLINLRVFEDENDKMNLSVSDIEGGILLIPNFTLYGDARKGRRPSYINGAEPSLAEKMYNEFVELMKASFKNVESGIFQTHMEVELLNDGPVTILLDSDKVF